MIDGVAVRGDLVGAAHCGAASRPDEIFRPRWAAIGIGVRGASNPYSSVTRLTLFLSGT
jgi:hypothetical protein